ncbi:MAG: GNAT family N-acetyltransferase, partial [Actinomycetia bacterium]|nr:GNAT family N-acetyltransferase [Actinomycetes bacterium]
YLAGVTTLLERVRAEHPTRGVWEAADLQWWWRKPWPTDSWLHPFWFDASGDPVAAAVATDWGGRIALDIIVAPSSPEELVEHAWHRGLAVVKENQPPIVEVMIDDDDSVMRSLVIEAGFVPLADKGASAWMRASSRPAASSEPVGYTLVSRVEIGETPHYFIARNGSGVAQRLEQTSLYDPSLDLAMLDATGEVAAYGLFWFDPVTKVGFVEPMGTNDAHRRKGLARHILMSGIDRLAHSGATRIKVNYEQDNAASSALYLDVGFRSSMTTSMWVKNETKSA